MRSAPHNDVLFFNLGLIFGSAGLYDEAIAAFRRSSEISPRPVLGPVRLKASDRIPAIEAEQRRVAALEADLARDGRLEGTAPGSIEWHRRLADLLDIRGERAAARGHELRALEAAAAGRP
jgi:tetratricopeptide (TPR) repeat protein